MIEYRKTAVTYQGDGNTSVFPFSFAVTDANSVRVSIYDKETDVSTELTRDYFVDMTAHVVHYPGYAPGEPVDAHAQPPKLPRGRNITIYRVTPINQLVDLGNKYPLPYIEAMADKVTAILQEHDEMLGRAVTSQKGSGITPKELIDSIFHAGEKTDAAMNAAKESASRAAESKTFAKSSEDAVRTMTEQVHAVFANSVVEIKKALGTEYVSQEQAKETRRILDDKAPIASPALTGTPTVPMATKGTSTDQIASTAFVAQAIAALVNSAPGALDTLQELAAALGNDANFAATVTNTLAEKVSKSGDTMIANLNFSGANIGIQGPHGYMQFGGNDKGDAIENNGANVNIASWWGLGFYDLCDKRYTGTMDLRSGNWRTVGKIRADQGFEGNLTGTASNSNTLGGQPLQWIVDQIGAAKTGIVASNLAENGWVKFANGLIVQWGIVKNGNGTQRVSFPISFGRKVFHINFSSTILSNDAITNSSVQSYSLAGAELYANTSPAGYVLWFAIGI